MNRDDLIIELEDKIRELELEKRLLLDERKRMNKRQQKVSDLVLDDVNSQLSSLQNKLAKLQK